MEKTIESIQVDERAVIGNVLDHTASGIARFDASENLSLFVMAAFLNKLTAGNYDVLAIAINLDNLEIKSLPHELIQILGGLHVDLG